MSEPQGVTTVIARELLPGKEEAFEGWLRGGQAGSPRRARIVSAPPP